VGPFEHNYDNDGHFFWPPPDSEQFIAHREFLYALQERVETLPYGDDELPELPYEQLLKEHATIFYGRILRNPFEERSELEEQLAGEIARRDEEAQKQTIKLTPEQYDAIQVGAAIRIDAVGLAS
jgi:hypothetical protein